MKHAATFSFLLTLANCLVIIQGVNFSSPIIYPCTLEIIRLEVGNLMLCECTKAVFSLSISDPKSVDPCFERPDRKKEVSQSRNDLKLRSRTKCRCSDTDRSAVTLISNIQLNLQGSIIKPFPSFPCIRVTSCAFLLQFQTLFYRVLVYSFFIWFTDIGPCLITSRGLSVCVLDFDHNWCIKMLGSLGTNLRAMFLHVCYIWYFYIACILFTKNTAALH